VKTVGQLEVFGALDVSSVAVSNDHVNVMWRYILTADIAIIIVFAIEWADVLICH
jgi:hypothetical protein